MKSTFKLSVLLVATSLFLSSMSFAQFGNITFTVLNPVCNNDGVVVAEITTPGTFLTYTWYTNTGTINHSSTAMSDTLFNFKGGLINLTVQDAGAIIAFDTFTMDFPFLVIPTFQADTCPLQTGAVNLAVSGGIVPFTYSWTKNGVAFPGSTNSLSNLSSGDYDCLITDASGCLMYLSDIAIDTTINVPSVNNITLTTSTTPSNCLNGTATVTPAGGQAPYTYLWSNGQTTQTATSLPAYSFPSVTVTDANVCSRSVSLYMNSNVNLIINTSVTNANCSFSDGAITAIPTGGTAPYTYLWNTLATTSTINNIPAGQYTVTVSDAQGCLRNYFVNLPGVTPVVVSYTTIPSQCIGATGSIISTVTGGIAPYTYEWYSNPIQTTANATNLAVGNYNYKVTDSQGCIRDGVVTIPQNTTLTSILSTTANVCMSNNGTATINAFGGVLPYTYLWNNNQTTQTITGMPSTNVYGTVTDADGCSFTECVYVGYISPMSFTFIPQLASCIYLADGSIGANVLNGTPPYTYDWSTGATTATINGLLHGYYSLVVTDAAGCTYLSQMYLDYSSVNPCSGTIEGFVFIDMNGNCIKDVAELGMQNIPIRCNTTGEIKYTNNAGNYSFTVPLGNVEMEQLSVPYRYQVCPATNPFTLNIAAAGMVINRDIADTVDWVNDLSIELYNYYLMPIVGRTYVQRIVEFNLGTNPISSTSEYDYDPQAPFLSSTPAPSVLNSGIHRADWTNPMILPLSTRIIDVQHTVPTTVPINTMLYYTDTIFPFAGDSTWWDNSVFRQYPVLGSFDPNYKEVIPTGTGSQGYISQADSILEYVIHFQNMGNYYAFEINILDQLDSDLEWNTLRVKYSTHNVVTEISPAGKLHFYFPNIYLPAISQDTILSNGFVVYTIKLKSNLPAGTQITNSADIYFDFNAAVQTNSTLNTIQITGLESDPDEIAFTVYPNPNSGEFTLLFDESLNEKLDVNLLNLSGQIIYSKLIETTNNKSSLIDSGELSSGVYVLQVIGKNSVKTSRIIVK